MSTHAVRFPNQNDQQLAARFDRPDGPEHAVALFAHCFTCSKDLQAVGAISRALNRQGIAVLRFDFTGLGQSEGDFSDTTFSSDVDDLVAAAEYLSDHYEAPRILVGHSLGGAATLRAAPRIDAVQAVSTIAAPCNPGHVTHLLDSAIDEIQAKGEAQVTIAGRSFTIRRQFLEDLKDTRMQETLRTLGRPLLLFHSPIDNIVGIDNAARIFESAKHPKSFVSLDDADHLLTDPSDAEYVGTVLGAWARKYVDTEQAGQTPGPEGAVVTRTGEKYRTHVTAGTHSFYADEPEEMGGDDAGPTPYGLLQAALGACTGMTLRMYADRKDWPLDACTVRLHHEKVHATDCESCETEEGKIDRIDREIDLTGSLSPEQRQRLLEIANKCPVHRTLHGEVEVRSRLLDESN